MLRRWNQADQTVPKISSKLVRCVKGDVFGFRPVNYPRDFCERNRYAPDDVVSGRIPMFRNRRWNEQGDDQLRSTLARKSPQLSSISFGIRRS